MKSFKPCLLMILDGWGKSQEAYGNAVKAAFTPNLDYYLENCPCAELKCSGEAVGLPEGVMGNSEVGHLNIGAGRIVYQDLLRINKTIEDKSFFENKKFLNLFEKTENKNGRVHIFGLLSDGRVHSSIKHLFALIEAADKRGIETIIHPILDGRDAPPDSGIEYLKELEEKIRGKNKINIATICGRFYAMDRDKRWDRVEKAYNLYTLGEGSSFESCVEAVKYFYERDITDEFVEPCIIDGVKEPAVRDGDGIIFINFRADRAREITEAFISENFDFFDRGKRINLSSYVTMTSYDSKFNADIAFEPAEYLNTLGEVVSNNGLKQLRIAETEKYAHVTYFFNGGVEKPYKGEERILVPSPRDVATYDLKPEMSAGSVCERLVSAVNENNYALIVLNYANMDMVGHTGNFEAAKKACEAVDRVILPVVNEILEKDGIVLITADHGNSEKMKSEDGGAYTSHTTNPVNLLFVSRKNIELKKNKGKLGDIAPTILKLMGLEVPAEMTGKSLV